MFSALGSLSSFVTAFAVFHARFDVFIIDTLDFRSLHSSSWVDLLYPLARSVVVANTSTFLRFSINPGLPRSG